MSTNISIFLREVVSEDNFYDYIKIINGKKQNIGNTTQGVIEKGDATIWLYYRGDSLNLDDTEIQQLNMHIKNAKTEIAIEISSDDESALVAKEFCEKIAEQYKCLVLYSSEGFFQMEDIDKALYIS